MRVMQDAMPDVATDMVAREFLVPDLRAAARFWDPLMAYLGWKRADDGIGAVVYAGGRAALVFAAGDAWDMTLNDARRVSPFAHLVFEVQSVEELTSLATSLRGRGVDLRGPRTLLEGEQWRWSLGFRDPNGLDVEVRCPMG